MSATLVADLPDILDQLTGGIHPGFRSLQAKSVIVTGTFPLRQRRRADPDPARYAASYADHCPAPAVHSSQAENGRRPESAPAPRATVYAPARFAAVTSSKNAEQVRHHLWHADRRPVGAFTNGRWP
jgi:hypothetical protein